MFRAKYSNPSRLFLMPHPLFVALTFFLYSCQRSQIPFDRAKWDDCLDGFCDYRESMIEDVMHHQLQKGMHIRQVREILGQPNQIDSARSEIKYDVFVDYGWNIDPIETKTLVISLKDSAIKDVVLHHWEAK